MTTLTASEARASLYRLIDQAAESHQPIMITGKRSNAVLLSAEDWQAIQETIYLLSVPGMRELLAAAPARVVAVSPYVGGEVIKGPTGKFIRAAGFEDSVRGVVEVYSGVIDAIVVDEDDPAAAPEGIASTRMPTLMSDEARRAEIAKAVLDYATAIA